MNRAGWLVATLTGTVGFLLGLVALRTDPAPRAIASARMTAAQPLMPVVETGRATGTAVAVDFAAVAARVNAAVVNVDAAVRGAAGARGVQAWRRDLSDDGAAPREGKGSGFIIDATGYILTNFHVVDGADRLTVTLGDGRAFRAEIAGIDPALDVALLKIAGSGALPVAVMGDSQQLRAGQWVCAIGNPLGYVHSVTVGVVSFLGRKLFDQTLDAYIQTDAAISLGNSGGPLIDAEGRVIGMTTAVSSQAANIGFAIPINQVLAILPQLRERGRVSRGFLGVGLTPITAPIERALGLSVGRGALVQDVTADSAAERAGLRPYDIITGVDDLDVHSDDDVIRYVTARAPGTITHLRIQRGSERHALQVKLTERPIPASAAGRLRSTDARQAAAREQGPLGLTVRELDASSALRRAIPETVQGVVVVGVDAAGPARLARLRPGQVVLEVNRLPTLTVAAFQAAVARVKPGETAAMRIYDPITDQRILVAIVSDGGT